MRCLYVLLACCCVCLLSFITASPIDPNRRLVKRPIPQNIYTAGLEPGEVPGAKGHGLEDVEGLGVKGRPVKHEDVLGVKAYPRDPDKRYLLKGEYYCGDKICSLKPGEIPEGCNGLCQYKI